MKNITLEEVLKLHKETKKSLFHCKQALQNTDTYEEAIEFLNKIGVNAIELNET